jgi:hypothetical protein
MSDCQRTGLRAFGMLNDPCVPTALDLCAVQRETGEQFLRSWNPSSGRPATADFAALVTAAWVLEYTIPALLLRGDSDSAMRRVEAIFHAAGSIHGLPLDLGHALWISLMRAGLDGCRLILASHTQPSDWKQVLEDLGRFDPRADLERALVGSRALGIEVFEAARAGRIDPGSDLARMCADVHAMDITGGVDMSFYLEVMQESIDLTRKDAWGPNRGTRDWQRGKGEFPLWAELSWGLLPWVDALHFRTLGIEADIDLARLAITASTSGVEEAERMASRTLDPFDGKPMRFRRSEGVWTVWSIGVDLVDDGGSSEEVSSDEFSFKKHFLHNHFGAGIETFTDDIVWRVRIH